MNTAVTNKIESDQKLEFPIPAGVYAERVVSVKHYTDRLFSFRITRPQTFRFRSGEFVMIGLPNAEKPVFRAYSIASPSWDEEVEFFSIKVPEGPLTQESWGEWTKAVKEQTGRKGKGLFMPLRKALTGRERGPEMADVLPLLQTIPARKLAKG